MEGEGKDKSRKISTGSFLKELISGGIPSRIILENIWYVMLLTLLGAVYIANRFHAERITRDMQGLRTEVRELRAQSLSTSAELMFISRQSEVYRMVRERGLDLEELKTPAFKLIVDN
ncbi:MAG TPA: FtsL-like putative cell division protein [Bacteroidales bacterium]|jgi:hypothetical protein|nr:FtsL-like putative cell division protein [Bacteroidales bacterium]HOS72649.1 FtsL-like putative cell division protein [Bacteroidales bacterium]HQH24068.1 FtsL-like putative cell division protein [Bacteroidales bacterium]HQJ83022.1 FtsL-like putative cell division protein [Bacteroidales bacterium]